jgi:3-deoxy-D-manno-octulosonate 8-phosphate phosphatase (KDO 8-P phosphatase)
MIERLPRDEIAARAERASCLMLDCDGVLTDGGIFLTHEGEEVKRFHTLDGHGIVMWRSAGHRVGIISGRGSRALEIRAGQLGVEFLAQRSRDKLASFQEIAELAGILPEEVVYVGDDVVDLPIMLRVGLAVAPANAVEEVVSQAHLVTERPGGFGAVREVTDYVLKCQGRWDELMAGYL